MLSLRPNQERGHAEHGWLSSRHTFSFAGYWDPKYTGFRDLLVINQDVVSPGKGFGTHPHRDMEIISYVLSGALEHKDSMGNGSVIRPGDVQRMTAGTGVTHSEFNHSQTEPVEFLQIWVKPRKQGLAPGYEQKRLAIESDLQLVASPNGEDGSVTIHQDVKLYAAKPTAGQTVSHRLGVRHAWLQLIDGSITIDGNSMTAGDGLAISNTDTLSISASSDAHLLLFDLA